MSFILFTVLLLVSLALSAMSAAFATLSTSHLRHWAKQQDAAAKKLYPLKARGSAALLTIEFLRAIFIAAAVAMLAVRFSPWMAGFLLTIIFFGAFVLLTQLYLKSLGMQLLVWLSTPLLSVTHALKVVMLPLGQTLDTYLADEPVALTKADLNKKLKSVSAEDTDLNVRELTMLKRVLKFDAHKVHDIMQLKQKLSLISINEILTPVVLNELHKSGQDAFPVMAQDNKKVVGVLNMNDVSDIHHNPSVAETMQRAQFINEDEPLLGVIDQFYVTKQPIFIATNGAGSIAGLLSIDVVLKELVGEKPVEKIAQEAEDTAAEVTPEEPALEQIAELDAVVIE